MIPDKENKGSPGPCHSRHNSLLPVLEDLTNKFRCQIPHQGIVQPSAGHLFTEFYISTMPDTEDFEHDEEILGAESREEYYLSESDTGFSDDEISVDVSGDGPGLASHNAKTSIDERDGKLREPPTIFLAQKALEDLRELLHPRRKKGPGHYDPNLNLFVRTRMEGMQSLLNFYTNPQSLTYEKWGVSAHHAAISLGRGKHCARQLCLLVRQFIKDRTVLPINPYGQWNESLLADEDLANEINIYLQSLGSGISGQKLVDFVNGDAALRARHGIDTKISVRTAERYLNALGYRYRGPLKGQYVDGHECADVVRYRQEIFLPQWRNVSERTTNWVDGDLPEFGPRLPGCKVVCWFHDESVFYAHDRRKSTWVHKDAHAKPYAKGDGASLMVSDFVSADFGWLRSPDEKRSARKIFKPGKNRDGYFSSDDVKAQVEEAMDILTEYYPEYEHVFFFDNAPTHLKRPDDALSARHMPKGTSKLGTNWGVEISKRDSVTGKIIHKPDGKPEKVKIRMRDAQFEDGTPQSLYYPPGHEREGVFKGMAIILEERGYTVLIYLFIIVIHA